MTDPRRQLTETERFVLGEVRAWWGDQNTEQDLFFTDHDEAALFVKDRDGDLPVFVNLTNIGNWHRDGTLTLEELRRWIQGPDA